MKKYLSELDRLCNDVINNYSFIREEDIRYVGIVNIDDLLIKFKDGSEMIFDKFLYDRVMNDYPTIREKDIERVNKVGEYDLLIEYKNGNRMIYDTFSNTIRGACDYEELPDELFKQEFKKNLERIMRRKFINQEELAERIGTSQTMISHYISGRCVPNAIVLKKIADALGCSTEDFYYKKF